MSQLKEIKRRIKSVNNISQVTHAMEMVAASRMRTAQENAKRGKAYTKRIREMVLRVSQGETGAKHPMLDINYSQTKRATLVIFSTQRGLAGPLPANMLRFVIQQEGKLGKQGYEVDFITVGAKISEQLARRGYKITADFSELPEKPTTTDLRPLLKMIQKAYLARKIGRVYLLYPNFVNPMTRELVMEAVLPVGREQDGSSSESGAGFIFEPGRQEVLDELIPSYLETQLYQARLETVASEYSARMVAMRNATDNAKEIKETLTLSYNKSRQAQITAEIAEITSGSVVSETT